MSDLSFVIRSKLIPSFQAKAECGALTTHSKLIYVNIFLPSFMSLSWGLTSNVSTEP